VINIHHLALNASDGCCEVLMSLRVIAVIARLAEIDRVTGIYFRLVKLAADDLGCSPWLANEAILICCWAIMRRMSTKIGLVGHSVSARTLVILPNFQTTRFLVENYI
jgi:hypothetical protein